MDNHLKNFVFCWPCIPYALYIKPTWCTIFLGIIISFLYMFQATVCPSSGETTVFMGHLVLVILCGWLSHVHPAYLTDYGHIVAWNVYRKKIDILTKIVLQFGFIYKITPSEPYCIYFLWKPQISKYCNLLILSSVLPLREFNLPEH